MVGKYSNNQNALIFLIIDVKKVFWQLNPFLKKNIFLQIN